MKMKLKIFVYLVLALVAVSGLVISDEEIIALKDLQTQSELELEESSKEARTVCPGNGVCSNHGICNSDGTCTCSQGWKGDGCSYWVTQAVSGQRLDNQHVTSKSWLFYTITTTNGNGLYVLINQTTVGGDADLYLLQSDIPTKSNYAYREISSQANFALAVPNAGANTWYIGVFGFLDTYFSITVSTTSQCPSQNNCNPPNGQCTAPGICTCNPGFTGSDCSIGVSTMTLNTPITGSVAFAQWKYYQLSVSSGNTLSFTVTETSNGDADLYISFNEMPDLYDYDYRDMSTLSNFTLSINQPSIGTYFVGIYGYSAVSYTIVARTAVACPNQCSLHGTCSGSSSCSCNSGFSGTYCQTMNNPLLLNIPVNGYVSGNSWNYYHVQPNTDSNLVIKINQTSSSSDCDLYAKNGANPTIFNYDYRDIGFGSNFQLSVSNPGSSMWYLGVFGFTNCQYSITASVSNLCPNNCSSHGSCSQGTCVCQSGYGGADCSLPNMPVLVNGNTMTSNQLNSSGQWAYFQLNVAGSSFVTITLQENQSNGFIWLYVSKNQAPTTGNYDYADQETNSQYHYVHIQSNTPQTNTYIIGVYSNPFATGPTPFSISAWYSPF